MVDLHTHSNCSDGTLTPAELVGRAKALELRAVALSDHNTIEGLPAFLAAAREQGVEAVPGVEFSTDYGETELHILALFVPRGSYDAITALLRSLLERKEASNRRLIERLNAAGYAISYDAVRARGAGVINRAHVAAELTARGYTRSNTEAFETLLSPRGGLYQPAKRLDALETVSFIRSIGALAVLAHPFLNLDPTPLRAFLATAKPLGLDGMETRYSLFDAAQERLADEIADEFGLLRSGGSDFHGANKPDIALGTGRGGLCVPDEYFCALRDAAAAREGGRG